MPVRTAAHRLTPNRDFGRDEIPLKSLQVTDRSATQTIDTADGLTPGPEEVLVLPNKAVLKEKTAGYTTCSKEL